MRMAPLSSWSSVGQVTQPTEQLCGCGLHLQPGIHTTLGITSVLNPWLWRWPCIIGR
jgi:hypothetical protein